MPCLTPDEKTRRPPALRRTGGAVLVLAFSLGLAGCAAPPLPSYDLDSASTQGLRLRALRGTLAVDTPEADETIDSDRVLVRAAANQLAYLSDARWSERLPALVQSRLIETFQNAHQLKSVGRPGDLANYSLQLELRSFEIDATASEARVDIAVVLRSRRTSRPVAAHIFAARAPAPATANGAAAAALGAALSEVMRSIVAWTNTQI